MTRTLPLLLAVLAACGGTTRLVIRERTRLPQHITMSADGKDGRWVKVRTEGEDTIVDFRGREFVFRDLAGYRGELRLDAAELEIGDADVEITEEQLYVSHGDIKATLAHEDLPRGRRVVSSAGSLTVE